MKVRIYFRSEPEAAQRGRLRRHTLGTIYDLLWESEFKNLITIGKLRLKVNGKAAPVGIPIRKKRSHAAVAPGDLIEMAESFTWSWT